MITAQATGTQVPPLTEAVAATTGSFRVAASLLTPQLTRFENGVREFIAKLGKLTQSEFEANLDTARSDDRFPVVAEYRLSVGSNLAGDRLSGVLKGLACALGYRPAWGETFRSIVNPDIAAQHLHHVVEHSPALRELRERAGDQDLDLMVSTGGVYISTNGGVEDQVIRLVLVLKGAQQVIDPPRHILCGLLTSTHSTMIGHSNIE